MIRGPGKHPAVWRIRLRPISGHEIAVLKNRAYTIDEIIQKRLYFLIPFFIFNYDHLERYEADAKLLAEMCGQVIDGDRTDQAGVSEEEFQKIQMNTPDL